MTFVTAITTLFFLGLVAYLVVGQFIDNQRERRQTRPRSSFPRALPPVYDWEREVHDR